MQSSDVKAVYDKVLVIANESLENPLVITTTQEILEILLPFMPPDLFEVVAISTDLNILGAGNTEVLPMKYTTREEAEIEANSRNEGGFWGTGPEWTYYVRKVNV